MQENFIVAVSAVLPIFFLMFIGVIVKRMGFLNMEELNHMNRMVFRVFFFCLMFYSIYTMNIEEHLNINLAIFCFLALLGTLVLAAAFVSFFVKDNKKRGAMIQAIFRSNYVIMGVPLVQNIYGDEAISVPAMLVVVVVPFFNVFSVIVLETYRGGNVEILKILSRVLQNPMILGGIFGALFMILSVKIPEPILKPIRQVALATTPIALIILGASFQLNSFHAHIKELTATVLSRLFIVPAVVLAVAVYMGYRGVELLTLLSIFATPTAIASFAMAQQMDSDAELAGNAVVYTSLFACFTVFLWVFAFKMFNFI
ncbi:MAG: AEC family transporter [Selenomonadaceae bacterium]|nr:AEC family transporter [Selenomonadaceae bacterium]